MFFTRQCWLCALFLILFWPASPVQAQTISDIQLEGLERIEKDAIMARIQTEQGSDYSEQRVQQDAHRIFELGYFYNVEAVLVPAGPGDATLVFRLQERPSVESYVFEGNSEVSSDELREASGLTDYEVFNTQKIQAGLSKIAALYEEKGYFLTEIDWEQQPGESESLTRVIFKIRENDKVKVRRINFIGNENLSAAELKAVMLTKEGGFFSFLSGGGSYRQEAFDRDVQVLSLRYFNEGFVQAKIARPEVQISPDKKGVFITIRVEEGEKFFVGEVDFAGDLMFPKEELYQAITIDKSDVFVWEKMQQDMSALQAKYGDLGYAYANIIPRTNVREQDRKVDVVFSIERGNKVYFGQINVKSNTRTRDKVVRRELLIKEGELYNETKRRESMAAVQRLGFFEEVQFNPSTPLDNPDVMNVDIVVRERNTGSLQVGAGYSTYSQFIFNGQINQTNLFGRGQSLGLSVDYSRLQSLFNLNFTEPYLFDTEWSFGVDAYKSRRIREEFLDDRTGGALRLGHPLSRFLRGYVRYKLDETEVILDPVWGDPVLFPVETVNGTTSSITFTLEYDRRNDRFMPTDGVFTSGSFEYAGLGGDLQFSKGFYAFRYYKKFFWEFVFRNNINYGFVATSSDREPPFTELYRLGGPYNLRGFQFGSVGKRIFSPNVRDTLLARGYSPERANQLANVVFGGRQQFFYNAEIEFPLIGEAGVRGVVFFDIGQADDVLRFDELRSNFGLGFRWFSPIGPLRFEWGFPLDLRPEYGESPTNFEFSIGAPF